METESKFSRSLYRRGYGTRIDKIFITRKNYFLEDIGGLDFFLSGTKCPMDKYQLYGCVYSAHSILTLSLDVTNTPDIVGKKKQSNLYSFIVFCVYSVTTTRKAIGDPDRWRGRVTSKEDDSKGEGELSSTVGSLLTIVPAATIYYFLRASFLLLFLSFIVALLFIYTHIYVYPSLCTFVWHSAIND